MFLTQVETLYATIVTPCQTQPDKAKAMTTRLRGANLVDTCHTKEAENKIDGRSVLMSGNKPPLEANGRIATNGVSWGDDVDPIDVETER